jgi:branched-chain amino acid aminotransferase
MTADLSNGAAWMNGEIVPISEAKVPVTDWGFTRSDCTYDVASVRNGAFFRLDDYLDRFQQSLKKVRIEVPQSKDEMGEIVHSIVAASGLRDSYVAMVASRGVPLIPGTRDPRQCANHFFAWCIPYLHVIKPDVAARGAHLYVPTDVRRIPPDSVDPTAKNYHWGDLTRGLFEALDAGFDTALLLDHQGNVTEGPGFNVFLGKGQFGAYAGHGRAGRHYPALCS